MDVYPKLISNEDADRIKEVAAEEFLKLRKSLSSSELKGDSSSGNYCEQSRITQAEKAEEISTDVFSESSDPIAHMEAARGLTNTAGGAKRYKEVRVHLQGRCDVNKYASSLERRHEEVLMSPIRRKCYRSNHRSRFHVIRSSTCLTKFSACNAEVDSSVDFPVKDHVFLKHNNSSKLKGKSSTVLLNKVDNQPERDFSPIIVDCIYPISTVDTDLTPSDYCNVSNSQAVAPVTKCSDSVEVLSDTEISVVFCDKSASAASISGGESCGKAGGSLRKNYPSLTVVADLSPSFYCNVSDSLAKAPETKCSDSAKVLSDSEISVIYCGKSTSACSNSGSESCEKAGGPLHKVDQSGNKPKELSVSQAEEINSLEEFVAHLISIQGNDNLRDLFTPHDIKIIEDFYCMNAAAQKILIQLLNSEFTWYRVPVIIDAEVNQDIKSAIDILIEKQFVITGTSVEEISSLVQLLSVQELEKLCKDFGLRYDGSRRIISESSIRFTKNPRNVKDLENQDYKQFIRGEILKILGTVIKLNNTRRKLFLRTQLLHALPLSKTMQIDGRIQLITIINCVSGGKVTYPDYAWKPLPKLFDSQESFKRFQNSLLLEANIKSKMKSKDYDEVVDLHESAIIQFRGELKDGRAIELSKCLPDYLRAYTRGTVLARAVHHSIECLRGKKMYSKMISAYQILLSQDLYLQIYKGIWYDQLAHIYQHIMKDIPQTITFLTEAIVDPSLNFIDRVCLSNRAYPIVNVKKRRMVERQKYEELKSMLCILKEIREIPIKAVCYEGHNVEGRKFSYLYETEEGVGQILSTPEDVIRLHFEQSGYRHGVHAPFGIVGSSIFGILFWDLIYHTEVPNVFLCPYQSLPLDLTSGEFYTNRECQINLRLCQIKELWNNQEMDDHIHKTWSREEGKKSIVSWKIFEDSKQFEVMLKCIGRKLLANICEKMAKDFYLLQKGFPSMILWNQTFKTSKFIQVKKPNSQLTPCQTSWLLYLKTAGGDAFACVVNAVGSKTQKRNLDIADNSMNLEDALELDVF